METTTSETRAPWDAYPCAPYVERLITGLNSNPVLREVPREWIVGRSFKCFKAFKARNGITCTTFVARELKKRLPLLEDRRGTQKTVKKKSFYSAVVYEFMCNFEMMQHFTSLTTHGRAAMRKLSRDNEEIMHTLAVAQLYCTATRHLPKEGGEE